MTASNTATVLPVRVLNPNIELPLSSGTVLKGSLEHYTEPKSLVVFGEDGLEPALLTVSRSDAPVEHEALATDEVIVRNWTEMRGAAEALQDKGIIMLTGQEVFVEPFRLQAYVARVL